MAKQKIHTPRLYPKDDFVKVIPTTEPMGIYFTLRYLDGKDVNNWYRLKKQKDNKELSKRIRDIQKQVKYYDEIKEQIYAI